MSETILFLTLILFFGIVSLYKESVYREKLAGFLYSLSIRKRLMLINIAFIIPLSVLFFFVISGVQRNIKFSTLEIRGNNFQQIGMVILKTALEQKYNFYSKPNEHDANLEYQDADVIYKQLEEYINLYGKDLQVTDKDFIERNKPYLSISSLKKEWKNLRESKIDDFTSKAQKYDTYIGHVFELILYVGDSSNLILDPDLDSYYTMNVTSFVLPNIINRLSDIINIKYAYLSNSSGSARIEALMQSRLLLEDIKHIDKSISKAIIEDSNFYDENPNFKATISKALADFKSVMEKLILQLSDKNAGINNPKFFDIGDKDAISASFLLWETISPELGDFLSIRINSFQSYQQQILLWTGISVIFALILFWFITGSVTRPIINLQKIMTVIADSTQKIEVPYLHYRDEIGMMARAVEWFRTLQDIISKQNIDLIDAKDKAEKATHAKANFLANMSHELRTPMNGVLGVANLLADTPLNTEQKEFVATINGSAENLLMLLNDILDFSKIEAEALVLENITFNFPDELAKTINLLRPQAEKKGIKLLLEYAADVPAYIWGDSGRLRQVIMNLVSNAVKFTDNGYVRLHASVRIDDGIDKLYIGVEDTGVGIPSNKFAEIFDKFTQADASVTRKYGGTGLGLAICKQLVNLMGGEIGVDSIEGKGSVFWFVMPYKVSEEKYAEQSAKHAVNKHKAKNLMPVKEVKALLVEDYHFNQVFATKLLRKFGFVHIDLAENGLQAIEKYHEENYDIIFMDCQMPELDGYQATQRLRLLEEGTKKHTPIIAMTANAMMGDREKCLKAGMDDYISKPLRSENLKVILEAWIVFDAAKESIEIPQENIAIEQEEAPVDLEQLRMFTNDDQEEERALADLFLEQAQEIIEILRKNTGDDKEEDWKSAAHRFKGSAGNLGAAKLQNICKQAESDFESYESHKMEMLAAIEEELRQVKIFLDKDIAVK